MADTSPNAASRPIEPGMRTAPPEAQSVYREPIELFRLEEALPFAETPERQYNILSLIISRELAQAMNIVEPPPGTPLRAAWPADMRKLRVLAEQFRERKIPTPTFPSIVPLMGKDVPEYDITIDGDTPGSTVLGADLKPFLEVMMRHRLQSAYQEAIKPLWGWHLDVRTMLAKYKVWDMRSEFVSHIAAYTEADADRELQTAGEYVRGMTGRVSNAPSEVDEGGGEETYDTDDGGGDDGDDGDGESSPGGI